MSALQFSFTHVSAVTIVFGLCVFCEAFSNLICWAALSCVTKKQKALINRWIRSTPQFLHNSKGWKLWEWIGRGWGQALSTAVKRCANERESCHWPPTRCWLWKSTYWFLFFLDKLFLCCSLHDLPSSSLSWSSSYLFCCFHSPLRLLQLQLSHMCQVFDFVSCALF